MDFALLLDNGLPEEMDMTWIPCPSKKYFRKYQTTNKLSLTCRDHIILFCFNGIAFNLYFMVNLCDYFITR